MKRLLKKTLVVITKRFGYKILSNSRNDQESNLVSEHVLEDYENPMWHNFFTLLKNQDFCPSTIYDIGANKGLWTKACLKYFPDSTYYLFEPQKRLKEDINNVIQGLNNARLFSVGLGKSNGELNFTIHDRDDSCSYSFTNEEAKRRGYKQIKMPIYKLETYVRKHNLNYPILMKIDAEGLDIEVLEGADSLLKHVEVIMIEVAVMNSRLKNTALETQNFLDKKGFKLFDITDINRPFTNKVLWLCEFVFIKKNGILDKDYTIN